MRQRPALLVLIVDLDMDCGGQLHYSAFAENVAESCRQLVSSYDLTAPASSTAARTSLQLSVVALHGGRSTVLCNGVDLTRNGAAGTAHKALQKLTTDFVFTAAGAAVSEPEKQAATADALGFAAKQTAARGSAATKVVIASTLPMHSQQRSASAAELEALQTLCDRFVEVYVVHSEPAAGQSPPAVQVPTASTYLQDYHNITCSQLPNDVRTLS